MEGAVQVGISGRSERRRRLTPLWLSRQGRDLAEIKIPKRERAEKKPRANRVERRVLHSETIIKFRNLRAQKKKDRKQARRVRLNSSGEAAEKAMA